MNPSALARAKGAALADYVREGVARGAYLIASELARSGDGRCEVQINIAGESTGGESAVGDAALRITCSGSELAAASERLSAASLGSLATWLRAGLVRTIEINLRDGRVDLAIH